MRFGLRLVPRRGMWRGGCHQMLCATAPAAGALGVGVLAQVVGEDRPQRLTQLAVAAVQCV